MQTIHERTIEEMRRDAEDAADKAQMSGITSLSDDERSHYSYYLSTHCYKKDKQGEPVAPIPGMYAEIIKLENTLFILNQEVYFYNDKTGTYEPDANGIHLRSMIRGLLGLEFVTDRAVEGIYNLILHDESITITDKQICCRPAHWVHFTNGYYDYKTNDMHAHNPKYNEIFVCPYRYDPYCYPERYKFVKRGSGLLAETVEEPLLFNQWIEEAIPDFFDRYMLFQYIAYSMTLETGKQKFLLICGPGGTGKSTLLSLIEEILGHSNVSSVSLQGLQERFTPGELYLKQANICADIPLAALSEVDTIKKLTGQDLISADRKFKSNILFRSFARLFFSANDIPVNLSDKSNAFYRRMLILKMDHVPEKMDPDLIEKLKPEIPNIITMLMSELYCEEGDIEESEKSKQLVREAYKNSDSVEAFIDDRCELNEKARVSRVELYSEYYNYCTNEGRRPVSKQNFNKQMENKGFPSRRSKNNFDIVGLKLSNIIPMPMQETAGANDR